ncbi:RIPOR family member 3 isoform X1 [Ornithorhynchus anatinus]|nr:RIPOR family member 3 isoform X1 [Ornithorhynchus anatinus]XP_028926868.1 RIPOR family member 3 isoform X1 [Ornithorhynchus anatinus]XP_039768829.1 RIPOR family member 3 isoform X1 [Ornithorhynchus anatinus]
MSVKVKYLSPGDVGAVGRSSSFAGFSTGQERKIAKSLSRNSTKSKKSSKSYAICLDPKPQQVKRIFEALKKGLKEYLGAQQAELDYLSGRHNDVRRNSRLAFYYDLDKQTRSVERHIRKMEFHISKVEELYEGYCIQCRLRDGASNMQHAFALSPSTKASRESLVELCKNLQECSEDMCLIEGALEVHLGEFHVKMKGLVGFARLCPGDHYEVLIRLGRQRWRLKGKIEADDSQIWDEEEKVFIPTLRAAFEIKVTELRGLTSLLVGMVMCDVTDFFTTRPQAIVVDITELGTIKLQLEVTWNPFDTESFFLSPGMATKFSVGSRKGSLYNWTPPNTPSFREKYYLSVLQQQGTRGGCGGPALLRYLSDGDLDEPLRGCRLKQPEGNEVDSFSSDDPREAESAASASDLGLPAPTPWPHSSIEEEERWGDHLRPPSPRLPPLALETPRRAGARPMTLDLGDGGQGDPADQKPPRTSGLRETIFEGRKQAEKVGREGQAEGSCPSIEKYLQEVLDLLKMLQPGLTQLQELEYQVLCFRDRLKARDSYQERSSMESLMETVLESFDFLNADFHEDDLSLFGSVKNPSVSNDGASRSLKALTKELTAGTDELDVVLIVHLQVCRALLQKLISPNLASLVQESLLEELFQQKGVLETLSSLDLQVVRNATSVEDILPQAIKRKRCLKLWRGSTEPGRVLVCSAAQLQNQLKKTLLHKIKAKYPGQLETVCVRMLEQMVTRGGLLAFSSLSEDLVTWFQFHGYLQKQNVNNLEKHFARLTKEVTLVEEVQCPGRLKRIKRLKGKRLSQLQPLPQTLRTLALLQLEENRRVGKAATSCLAGAAKNKSFREKAVLFYTDALTDRDGKLQQAACIALKHLRGIESIDQIASLCQSDLEDVRTAARETTLSFGEKGRSAFEKMDRICCEMRETLRQEADIEITIF